MGHMTSIDPDRVPEATFTNFLDGLRVQTLVQLGEIPDPSTGVRHARAPLARYSVQLLHVLQTKTEGQREPDEDRLLQAMIDELEALLARHQR